MASKSYQASETSTTWTDTGGDKLLDIGGITNDAVKVGAYLDLGASPRADMYEVVVLIDGFSSNPTVDRVLEIYFTESLATTGFDGQLTTDPTASAHGSATIDQIRLNCRRLGEIKTYSTVSTDVLQKRFVTKLSGRYVSPIVLNKSGTALASSSETHSVILTPIPQEGQ